MSWSMKHLLTLVWCPGQRMMFLTDLKERRWREQHQPQAEQEISPGPGRDSQTRRRGPRSRWPGRGWRRRCPPASPSQCDHCSRMCSSLGTLPTSSSLSASWNSSLLSNISTTSSPAMSHLLVDCSCVMISWSKLLLLINKLHWDAKTNWNSIKKASIIGRVTTILILKINIKSLPKIWIFSRVVHQSSFQWHLEAHQNNWSKSLF